MIKKTKILLIGAHGYIGYKLFLSLLKKNYSVVGIDNFIRDKDVESIDSRIIRESYQNLNFKYLDQFTDCVWLAGHSSVKMSMEDENGALKNNLFDLINFSNLFRGRFIYASSGSVYSRQNAEKSTEDSYNILPTNVYDYTKVAFDNYISVTKKNAIGLRFGTVNGYSKRLRDELMINSMLKSSIKNGYLSLMNGEKYRPILFIDELITCIHKILESKINSGIFNLASLNCQIKDIAEEVSSQLNSKIIYATDKPTYNFMMNTKKFEETFNYRFSGSIENIINSFDSDFVNTLKL